MPCVRILNASRVPLPPGPSPPPGDTVRLSFFDTLWVVVPPIQRLFLYPDAALPYASIVDSLKSSLSRTLPLFHPFAGNLTYLPAYGDAVIDCSTSAAPAVSFLEAESDLDIRRLAEDETHDLESFLQLVPDLGGVRELPAPVLAVQVTEFAGGGVAVGLAVHHAVTDGKGIWRFVESWAAACRGRGDPPGPTPLHDRAIIRHRTGDDIARLLLRRMAPALPKIAGPIVSFLEDRFHHRRRTFTLAPAFIQSLKQRAVPQSTDVSHCPITTPSTFVAISAHAWLCIARAKALAGDAATTLGLAADCRARLDPPLDEAYAGNCIRGCFAQATASELLAPGGLALACERIRLAVRAGVGEPLREYEESVEEYKRMPRASSVIVVGSPRFRVYETDFGWGRPARVELVSMNHDGEVVLVAGREEGEVQASVALSARPMDSFSKLFVGGFDG
ncbi:malonyl-coenzyme A:anthocyanin 3-O-glucoside-6''-O-malonyltransferase-like [Elaeis guineensis]|uniref:Malonyl-coenzyme A:anthocyanin 3-O-glucoside-6''-O-malonyltransferase-like n=1 Tax=Elaeis guineensis var. tenera TaxID=51953 RepID=A0A6I9QZJ6_ELAGV|nr:malonyl-coenzyme A:anthocyanin 3-O-glucoside-6''-O-malonyltransferase-like [Elaeis guineensis]